MLNYLSLPDKGNGEQMQLQKPMKCIWHPSFFPYSSLTAC